MNKLNLPFTVYEERCIAIYFEVSRPFIFIRDLNKTAYPNEGRNLTCSNYAHFISSLDSFPLYKTDACKVCLKISTLACRCKNLNNFYRLRI